MKHKYSLIFFGSSQNSLIVLKELFKNFQVNLVVTAPPRPTGRKQILTKTPVHEFAKKNKIPLLTPEKLNASMLKEIKNSNPDAAIVADYAQKIPPSILDIPKHGFLNLHPSLLPQYRGSTPAQTAILNGDKITGLTIFKMDENFDTGPIISWFKEEIKFNDKAKSLYSRLFTSGSQVLKEILPAWIEGKIIPREQDNSLATYAPRLTRQDGFIPWDLIQNAILGKNTLTNNFPSKFQNLQGNLPEIIERAIRAFYPWPGIWTIVKTKKRSHVSNGAVSDKRLKILSAAIKNHKLILEKVQLEGQKPSNLNQIKNQII